MSSSPESKKTSQSPSNPGTAPVAHASAAPAAQPAPAKPATAPAAAKPVAPATTHPTSNNNSNHQSNVQFKTANIGQWAAKQENPFAAQNRRADEKRQQAAKTRRKVLPIVAIVGGIVAVSLVTWGVILLVASFNKPEPEEDVPVFQPILNYRDTLQNVYNNNVKENDEDKTAAIEAVAAVVDEAVVNETNPEAVAELRLSQLLLYINNEDIDAAAAIAQDLLKNEALSVDGQTWCWDALYQKAIADGDAELAQEYMMNRYKASVLMGGEGGA